jgi:ligand-binding sensor domain-containing protein
MEKRIMNDQAMRKLAGLKGLMMALLLAGSFSIVFGQSAVKPLGIQAKKFQTSAVDANNVVWFSTDAGVVNFDGSKWTLVNGKIATDVKSVATDGRELLVATPQGAAVAAIPVDANAVTNYATGNSSLQSNNVLSVATGKGSLKWFGTDKGVFAFKDGKWLANNYDSRYPADLFTDYPITSMTSSLHGDTLYAATVGAGVLRVYRDDVDGVSGASEYAFWGPIIMPSDNVYAIHISANGVQWLGTDKGVAKHVGYKTLEGWSVYSTAEGLVDDFVQAIGSDSKGILWFGTKNGLSSFDGTKFTNYKVENGLASNNILSIVVDKKDVVWVGTDDGVTSISGGNFVTYR